MESLWGFPMSRTRAMMPHLFISRIDEVNSSGRSQWSHQFLSGMCSPTFTFHHFMRKICSAHFHFLSIFLLFIKWQENGETVLSSKQSVGIETAVKSVDTYPDRSLIAGRTNWPFFDLCNFSLVRPSLLMGTWDNLLKPWSMHKLIEGAWHTDEQGGGILFVAVFTKHMMFVYF